MTVAEPPSPTALAADLLVEPWFRCLSDRLPQVGLFDCHTHLGEDPDGSRQTARELGDALDLIGARAVVFPLASSQGYGAANDHVLAAATESSGRLVAFCRIDPRADGVAEAQRALALGASGIKLHPRQEGVPEQVMDEPPSLGEGTGSNAARVLAAAVGTRLSASALYCLRRAHIDVEGMHTTVEGSLERNTASRLRIRAIHVLIEPLVAEAEQARMRRCLELFEDFCVVTQSIRAGIEVQVDVEPTPSRPPA